METMPINNMFVGFLGGVNAGMPAEQSSSQERSALDFLTILKSIIGAGCFKAEATDAENDAVIQQLCIPASIYPVLPALLQKISIANMQNGKGEDGGLTEDLSENLLKEQSAKEEGSGSVEINLAKVDAASINVLVSLVTLLFDALSKTGTVNLSIGQTAGKSIDENTITDMNGQSSSGKLNGSDEKSEAVANVIAPLLTLISDALSKAGMRVVQTAGKSIDENTITDMNGQSSSGKLNGTDQKKPSNMMAPQELAESILAAGVANDAYTSTEQFVAKKEEKGESLRNSPAVEKVPAEDVVLTIAGREDQSDDKAEVLLRNIADMAARGGINNRETAFSNHLQAGTDTGDGNNNRNGVQVLLAQGEKLFTESVVKQKEEIVEPQGKDLKASFKENDYLPFSKNDNPDSAPVQEPQNHKVLKETAFSSVMTEKIEKLVEQLSAKSTSMDMVLRLKIDDRETLLVGLKSEGAKVMVDVKTSNEGVMNILQTQKDVISRNLEEKHVYTNIFIDPDGNDSFERRESRREDRRNEQESGKKTDFTEFLEASA